MMSCATSVLSRYPIPPLQNNVKLLSLAYIEDVNGAGLQGESRDSSSTQIYLFFLRRIYNAARVT